LKESIYIIKIGGNIIDDDGLLQDFLKKFAAITDKKILVHGGGKLATRLAAQLNIPQQMVEGRRITDAETLKIVTMVYAGLVNKSVVAALQSFQCNAIGVSGTDGDLIRSVKRGTEKLDFGFVGDVQKVNSRFLLTMINNGFTPVVAPITHDGQGVLLNTNADTIAQAIATSLTDHFDVNLVYSFEKKGVLLDVDNDESLIPVLDPVLYDKYRKDGKIFAGMIPKLDNAFSAIAAGVKKVIIGKAEELEVLVSGKTGTILTNEEHAIN